MDLKHGHGHGPNRTRMQARRPNRKTQAMDVEPSSRDCPIATYLLKVKMGGFQVSDAPQSRTGATYTVGVWGKHGKDWILPPMSAPAPDDSKCLVDEHVKFIVPAGDILDSVLILRVTTKKLMSLHDIGSVSIPLHNLLHPDWSEEEHKRMDMTDFVLIKQGARTNPNKRGVLSAGLSLVPLTYSVDGPKLLQRLPHTISMWVISFIKQADTKPNPQSLVPPGLSNLARFREFASSMVDTTGPDRCPFAFGEVPFSAAVHGRDGTKVAFGIEDTASTGEGKIVAVVGSQKLVVTARENFESRVQEWTHQFAEQSDSSVWQKAVEAMQQLSPCTVVDLFGDSDSSDFDRISIITRLIVEVSDVLSTGTKEERAEALRTLAVDAPQALSIAALNVSYEALLSELEGVIYEADDESPSPGSAERAPCERGAESYLRKRISSHATPGSPMSGGAPQLSRSLGSDSNLESRTAVGTWKQSPSALSKVSSPSDESSTKGRIMSFFVGKKSPTSIDTSQSWHGDPTSPLNPPSPQDSGGHDASPKTPQTPSNFDTTWHGTPVKPGDLARMEISEEPRHGTLRPKKAVKGNIPPRIRAVDGSVEALQVLGTVLGRDFLVRIALPCVLSDNTNHKEAAKAIGQIFLACHSNAVPVDSLVAKLKRLIDSPICEVRCLAVESITVIAKQHVDSTAQSLALSVASKDVHPQVLLKLIECLPELLCSQVSSDTQRPGGKTGGRVPPRLQRQRLSEGDVEDDHWSMGSTATIKPAKFPNQEEVGLFSKVIDTIISSYDVDVPEEVAKKCFNASLALLTAVGVSRWNEVRRQWKRMVDMPCFTKIIAGGLHLLCRLLCPERFDDITRAGAPLEAHSIISRCLDMGLCVPGEVAANPSQESVVNLWVWRALEASDPHDASLLANLPVILACLPPADRRVEWLYIMQSVYRSFLVSRRVLLDNANWAYQAGAETVLLGGQVIDVKELERKLDAHRLVYQLPAAVAMMREAGIAWEDAPLVHQAMSEDDNAQLRWMVARSLHVYPALFSPEITIRLSGVMNKLLHDSDLDVAEGVHKGYMDFVTAVHKINTEVAKLLATGFFDAPLWERRLHFSVYKAEQLVQLAVLDLLPGGAALCVATASELFSHTCTEVRKQAAASAAEIIIHFQGTLPSQNLLDLLVSLSGGTCRQKQTFLWGCEQMLFCNRQMFNDNFYEPLKTVAAASHNNGRSLVYNHAWTLLGKVESAPAAQGSDHFSRKGLFDQGSGRRFTSSMG